MYRPNTALAEKAMDIRRIALETALKAGKGHVAPAFSWADLGVMLYYGGVLRVRPEEPHWPDRDRLILSKGHACLTLYAILADQGFFPSAELDDFAGDGSLLPGHPDHRIPGVDVLSGSLGHGLGVAAGMAFAAKVDDKPYRVFTILGDGECHEGSVWEAAMFAGHHRLANMVAILDNNGLSATNYTDQVVTLGPVADRFAAFGWDTVTVDGHDFEALARVFDPASLDARVRPLAVIAQTVKGKGVDFMENSPKWHHQLPKGEQVAAALAQLRTPKA
ncbi:transketolase [Rhodospirillum sp. A1_3_36]|uniref:transketolase n=1 Tax=Rhodospirillum sp. A1_3_36 TaxID=3391666 RepID=UPI0039A73596